MVGFFRGLGTQRRPNAMVCVPVAHKLHQGLKMRVRTQERCLRLIAHRVITAVCALARFLVEMHQSQDRQQHAATRVRPCITLRGRRSAQPIAHEPRVGRSLISGRTLRRGLTCGISRAHLRSHTQYVLALPAPTIGAPLEKPGLPHGTLK